MYNIYLYHIYIHQIYNKSFSRLMNLLYWNYYTLLLNHLR